MTEGSTRSGQVTSLQVLGYFVVFFAAMGLGGFLFLLGGVTLVLIPGSLPLWVKVGYVGLGIVGSVAIAVLAANGAFRRTRPPAAAPARPPTAVAWVAGVVGTVVASVLSAALGAVVLRWIER